jgi:hypothetical protein
MQPNFIQRTLATFFPRAIHDLVTSAAYEAVQTEQQLIANVRAQQKVYEIKSWLGKKVIILTNEWEDPVFGIVRFYPMLKGGEDLIAIQDVLNPDGDPIFTLPSSILPADDKMIEAILKLNPFERWNMRNRSGINLWSKNYPLGPTTDSKTLARKLQKAGFYIPTA